VQELGVTGSRSFGAGVTCSPTSPSATIALVEADIPLRRMVEPAEVARAVACLASEQKGDATGATFDVNGGVANALNHDRPWSRKCQAP
jgi:NAD(P)-dependent dehydrogenase (short-subunit alcohol dehydrogenase family)